MNTFVIALIEMQAEEAELVVSAFKNAALCTVLFGFLPALV